MYCGWLNFRGVPIFVVFVEGPVYEIKYPKKGFSLWIMKENAMTTKFKCVIFGEPRKLVPTKIKQSTVLTRNHVSHLDENATCKNKHIIPILLNSFPYLKQDIYF